MYDPRLVLASIDEHEWSIVALCGFAMICNYIYFISAVRQGFRDRTFPMPIFCTLFWLVGDSSMVLSLLAFLIMQGWALLFWRRLGQFRG
jgi:hypothetical protein